MNNEDLKSETLWVYIKKGEIHHLGLASVENYKDYFHPVFEFSNRNIINYTLCITNNKNEEILEKLRNIFQNLVKSYKYYPGHYGDWIKCTKIFSKSEIFLNIDVIVHAAWPKATMASDLGVIIKGSNDILFVGINRKNEPGEGLPAIAGGILEINKELDSSAYTAIKEAEEEIGLKIKTKMDLEKIRVSHDLNKISVSIGRFERIDPKLKEMKGTIYYVCTLPTTEQERLPDGSKRVYITSAFVLLIDISQRKVDEKQLKSIFEAGDDAADLSIFSISKFIETESIADLPKFGLEHHPDLLLRMIKRLKRLKKISIN